MNNKKILFIQSTGPFWDHRYYFKQIPALIDSGFYIDYICRYSKNIPNNSNITFITLKQKIANKTRVFGGLNLLKTIFSKKYKTIQLCNIELLPLGIFLKIFSKKRVFYDCREDHFHAMLHGKVWFPKWIRKILAFCVYILESLSNKLFDGIIFSDPALYKMHTLCRAHKKMIFYNMALNKQFLPPRKIEYQKLENKKYDLVVLGSMSIRTGVLDVIKVLSIFKNNGFDLKLKLIGDPSFDKELFNQINKIIDSNNLGNNIKITGRVSYDKIPIELSDCKIGIIPLLDIPKFQNNMATKQFEYLASGIAVVASDLKPQHNFLENRYNAYFYKAGDIDELYARILKLLENKNEMLKLINNGLKDINDKWNSESQQLKYQEFYNLRLMNKSYIEKELSK